MNPFCICYIQLSTMIDGWKDFCDNNENEVIKSETMSTVPLIVGYILEFKGEVECLQMICSRDHCR